MSRFERRRPAQLQRPRRGRGGGAGRACCSSSSPAARSATRRRRSTPGSGSDIVEAVGEPTEWVADRLPLARGPARAHRPASRPTPSSAGGGFDAAATAAGGERRVPPVTAGRLRPGRDRRDAPPKQELETLLVTGDSLSTPLDTELARRLAPTASRSIRDPHLGTGISNSAARRLGPALPRRSRASSPDAVVVFIGANEGYGMPGPDGEEVECCGPTTPRVYANRVRQVMDNYRQDGAAKVYWLTVMTPRDADAARVSRVVNAAIRVAAQPWASQVRVVDTVPVFTPGERYTDSIAVDGAGDDRPRVRRHPPERGGLVDRGRPGARPHRRGLRVLAAGQVFSANVCLNFFEPFSHFALALNCAGDSSRIFVVAGVALDRLAACRRRRRCRGGTRGT